MGFACGGPPHPKAFHRRLAACAGPPFAAATHNQPNRDPVSNLGLAQIDAPLVWRRQCRHSPPIERLMTPSTVLTTATLLGAAFLSASCGEPSTGAPTQPEAATAAADPRAGVSQDPAILAASQTTPEAFVRALYDVYADGPLESRRDNQTFYSRRTEGYIQGVILENGYFDFDPILAAQDYEAVSVTSAIATPSGPDRASVSVVFRNMGADSRAEFILVREPGGWRVDDVKTPETASLVAYLEASGRSAPGAGEPD